MCREDADAEFLNTVAAAVESTSPGFLTFLTGSCAMPGGRHAKLPNKADRVFLLSGPRGEHLLWTHHLECTQAVRKLKMPQLSADRIGRLDGLTAWKHCFDKLVTSADKIAELGPKVAAALGTRGGMRPGAFQGKVASLDRLPQALKVLHDSLAQSRRSLDNVVRGPWLISCCV